MPHHTWKDFGCEPPAFTVVEALVAIVLVGIAGAALAASITAGGALRSRARLPVVHGDRHERYDR